MASLEGKVIAVTGGASGIGLATAKVLLSRGATVSLADVREEALTSAAEGLKGEGLTKFTTRVVNTAITEDVDAWIDSIVKEFGRLDGAANIAGVIGQFKTLADLGDAEWDSVMNVNCTGVFKCLRAQLRVMANGGSIVNASSIAGVHGLHSGGAYVASKHAVVGMTKTAAREVGPGRGIRVNAIAPGVVQTPMISDLEDKMGIEMSTSDTCLQRRADASEIGNLVAFLLSDDSSFMTGTVYLIDGGFLT